MNAGSVRVPLIAELRRVTVISVFRPTALAANGRSQRHQTAAMHMCCTIDAAAILPMKFGVKSCTSARLSVAFRHAFPF
jgi:hypothetical protein